MSKYGHGHAMTYASQSFTQKFFNMDRIMFAWSPYLTFEESDKLMDQMELRALSQYEGNWTAGDCMMFIREQLGNDRVNAIERMWEIDQQTAIQSVFTPDDLQDTWVDKITLCEVGEAQRALNPNQYIQIKLPKARNV